MPRTKTTEKLQTFELFRKGIKIKDIENTSSVSRKTLYRWWDEFNSNNEPTTQETKEDVIEAQIEAVKEASSQAVEGKDISPVDWVNFASEQSLEGCICNGLIRKKLSQLMLNELEKEPDINFRAISALSSSINIHSRLEREYGMFDLVLNPQKAIATVEKNGYVINNPTKTETREDFDFRNMTPEELAREYKQILEAI
ncbi:helix-turn-helix domain-containing protein [Richelia sinica]|uniref:helix-turn-helix domain-containing protein n=1 Tax=Richelia sinica TaxID=1357545 RepID=UPI0016833EA4|nr:helix-turn-helix domain-containing protein [Richelia sinica]MBD2667378.1 helix-turn-helix domain-containing protein [Richelia sinica FACHB-800]